MEEPSIYPRDSSAPGSVAPRPAVTTGIERAAARPEASAAQPPVLRGIGQREREVMAVLWTQGEANVKQVASRLSTNLAYTTVMTTLDRLFKKGLLRREKRHRAFIYSTALTPHEVEGKRAVDLVRRFFSDSGERPEMLLSCLVDAVGRYDTSLLDQLESGIQAARARQLASTIETANANPDPEQGHSGKPVDGRFTVSS